MLQDAEDWLYTEEGEDAIKSLYVSKLDAVKAVGGPVALRFKEDEARPKAAAQLREATNEFLTKAQSGDEKYSHLSEKDLESVVRISSFSIELERASSSFNLSRSLTFAPSSFLSSLSSG